MKKLILAFAMFLGISAFVSCGSHSTNNDAVADTIEMVDSVAVDTVCVDTIIPETVCASDTCYCD